MEYLRLPIVAKASEFLGWLVSLFIAVFSVFTIMEWIRAIGHPFPGMTPLWGMLGLYLLVLLGIGGWLGGIHARRYQIPWTQAFGIMMAKFALLAGVICLTPYIVPGIGEYIGFMNFVLCYMTILLTFIVLEFAPPLR